MDIVISTRNAGKLEQIRIMLCQMRHRFWSLDDLGVVGSAVEDGKTLEDNARKKAQFAYGQTRKSAIGDDSGIFIEGLCNRPGIHSARWAEMATSRKHSTEEIMRFTLEKMIHCRSRRASLKTALVFYRHPESRFQDVFEGIIYGTILREPRGMCRSDMPYGPIFLPDGYSKTLAEMTPEEEVGINHRGKAFRALGAFLSRIG